MSAKRRFHHLRYFCSDAWDEWRHSLGVNLLALATLTSVLFVAGLVILVLSNIDQELRRQQADVRVSVYLMEDHDPLAREELIRDLTAMDSVAEVTFVSEDDALSRYREFAADVAELVNELDDNPLPASLEVRLDAGSESEETATGIAQHLRGHEAIEEVRFDKAWLQRLQSLMEVVHIGGIAVAVLVFVAIGFVMAGVLRLAVYARRDEIDIMQLVGATPAFIRGPFVVAGVAQGCIASGLALIVVELLRRVALGYAGTGSTALMGLVMDRPLTLQLSALLVAVGLVVSLMGSLLAVRQSITTA